MVKLFIGLCSFILSAFGATPDGMLENLYFVNSDLKSATHYNSVKYSEKSDSSFQMEEGFDKSKMTYIRPSNYTWTTVKDSVNPKSKIPLLNFSNISTYGWLETIKDDSFYVEKVNQNSHRLIFSGNACTGDCLLEENIISVIIPKNFVIKTYTATKFINDDYDTEYIKKAKVKQTGNTLTLYTSNVRGAQLSLVIENKSSSSAIYNNVSKSMSKYSEIKVTTKDNETKIVMPMDNVFDSGSAVTKEKGKLWLSELTKSLAGKKFKEIRVEGHTDNIPIKSTQFPSNWELSSARSSDAVKHMIEAGIPANKIMVIGFGDTKPMVKNDTLENKAKNRRIEITIVGSI